MKGFSSQSIDEHRSHWIYRMHPNLMNLCNQLIIIPGSFGLWKIFKILFLAIFSISICIICRPVGELGLVLLATQQAPSSRFQLTCTRELEDLKLPQPSSVYLKVRSQLAKDKPIKKCNIIILDNIDSVRF